MHHALIEIGTEEIPSRFLSDMSAHLARLLKSQLQTHHFKAHDFKVFFTPRRLAVQCTLESLQTEPVSQIRQGPNLKLAFNAQNEPTPAALGFAKSCQTDVQSLETLTEKGQTKLVYRFETPSLSLQDCLPDMIQACLTQFPLPVHMHWTNESKLSFVRPIRWIVAMIDDQAISGRIHHLNLSDHSVGHRFLHPESVHFHANDYLQAMEKAYVMVDFNQRRANIQTQVDAIKLPKGIRPCMDKALLDEVTNLVEYPQALLGQFKPEFLTLPKALLIATMKGHQRYFHIENEQGNIQPYFILISNLITQDSQAIVAGNEQVLHPRLADADFFLKKDKATGLTTMVNALQKTQWMTGLGTLAEKQIRIGIIAERLYAYQAKPIDLHDIRTASSLIKADLSSTIVGEFPELEGIAGNLFAKLDGHSETIAQAIESHTFPKNSGDQLPSDPLGTLLGLSDRLDSLMMLFGIGKIPSGTKDPFALRRKALGLLALLRASALNISLDDLITLAENCAKESQLTLSNPKASDQLKDFLLERMPQIFDTAKPNCIQAARFSHLSFLHIEALIKLAESLIQSPSFERIQPSIKRIGAMLKNISSVPALPLETSQLENDHEKRLFIFLSELEQWLDQSFLPHQIPDFKALETILLTSAQVIEDFFEHTMVYTDQQTLQNHRLAMLNRLFELVSRIFHWQALAS